MANTINLKALNKETANKITAFATDSVALNNLSVQYKSNCAVYNAKIEEKKSLIESLIKSGDTWDVAHGKVSMVEENNALNVLKADYSKARKPFVDRQKEVYALIPDGLYDAYKLKINGGNSDEFVRLTREFLLNMGMSYSEKAGLIRKTANRINELVGARVAQGRIKEFTESTFKKLWVLAVAEMLKKAGF